MESLPIQSDPIILNLLQNNSSRVARLEQQSDSATFHPAAIVSMGMLAQPLSTQSNFWPDVNTNQDLISEVDAESDRRPRIQEHPRDRQGQHSETLGNINDSDDPLYLDLLSEFEIP